MTLHSGQVTLHKAQVTLQFAENATASCVTYF